MKKPGGLMKAKKYTEEQIIAVLREAEADANVINLCRKYRDERRYLLQLEGKIRWSHRQRIEKFLKALEDENRR
jgi:putative transposase